jgi:hypothetical protein
MDWFYGKILYTGHRSGCEPQKYGPGSSFNVTFQPILEIKGELIRWDMFFSGNVGKTMP